MRNSLSKRVGALEAARTRSEDKAPFVALILEDGEPIPPGYDDARLILIVRERIVDGEGGEDEQT